MVRATRRKTEIKPEMTDEQAVANDQGDVFAEATAARQAEEPAKDFQAGHHEPNGNGHSNGHAAKHQPRHKAWNAAPGEGGHWKRNDAGVRIKENWKDKLHEIITEDRLPQKAVDLLVENGWQYDVKTEGFSKPMDKLRAHSSRERADEMALAVANIVLAEKGMPELKSFYNSRS